MDKQNVIIHTQNWISSVVIGLNLCPFAERGFKGNTIRYAVTEVTQAADLIDDLSIELETLASSVTAVVETTLLIHPYALNDFFEFNHFLKTAETLVRDGGFEGVIQVVGFHPDYHFQDCDSKAAQNYTNRSPYPMLHLLREESISKIAGRPDELLEIPKRNIRTLEELGTENILERLKACVPKIPQ